MCHQTASLKVEHIKHIAGVQGADTVVSYIKILDSHMGLLRQKHL